MNNSLFLKKYLDRIGINMELEPNLETLKKIQIQHLINIPFENLDIFLNRRIILDASSLFKKIIEEKRGGICYELNGLLLILLKELGYDVKYISAKIREDGTYLDHMLLMVNINKDIYLVDVGFRDNYLYPIKFAPNLIQKIHQNHYKVNELNNDKYQLVKIMDNIEYVMYTFTTDQKNLLDFITRCQYFEKTPNTYFTKNPFSAIETPQGKIFITDEKLIIKNSDKSEILEIKSKEEFNLYLEKYFNIKLSTNLHFHE